jgi:hypothetical protein
MPHPLFGAGAVGHLRIIGTAIAGLHPFTTSY